METLFLLTVLTGAIFVTFVIRLINVPVSRENEKKAIHLGFLSIVWAIVFIMFLTAFIYELWKK